MKTLRNGHARGHVRAIFCDAVEAFERWDGTGPEPAVEFEINYEPQQISISKACGLVWNCTDVTPADIDRQVRDLVGEDARLPKRRTYAAAARAIRHSIINQRVEFRG